MGMTLEATVRPNKRSYMGDRNQNDRGENDAGERSIVELAAGGRFLQLDLLRWSSALRGNGLNHNL